MKSGNKIDAQFWGEQYTRKMADAQAGQAIALLAGLPASRYRDALEGLARLAVSRSS